MSETPEKKRGVRLSPEDAWAMVAESHTGIFTTLKRDGTPIALPVWFALVDGCIWTSTPERSKKIARIRNNPRASFLVESGELWRELKAVHLTGTADIPTVSTADEKRIRGVMDAKYSPYRTQNTKMPSTATKAYANMILVRFTPDERIVSWSNAQLMG